MDAVLGLSMTPTTVGLVLVEGQDADGATMDRDAFAVESSGGRSGVTETCDQAAAAVLRSEAVAATKGHRLHSIGVTWSADADAEASMLLKSLSESGFDNVVAVRLPEASEALARGIADAIGYDTTAVCLIEPDTVVAMIVHLHDGSVETTVEHGIDDEEALTRWLSSIFARAAWEPEALVVVGSVDGLDEVMPSLEDALGVPVFAPAEAEVALARGAALASTQLDDHPIGEAVDEAPRRGSTSLVGPMTLLIGGTLTFVVSVSLALGLRLTADSETPTPAGNTAETPAAVQQQQLPPSFPPPVAIPPPLPAAPPPPEQLAPEEPAVPAEMPAEPPLPDSGLQAPPDGDVVPGDAVPPADAVPPPAPPAEQAVPPKKPGLLSRIRDRIGPDDETQQPFVVPPPLPVPPPPGAVPPPA